MSSKFLTIAMLVLAASASPMVVVKDKTSKPIFVVRDDTPKPAKTGLGGLGGFGGFGNGGAGSSSSSVGGLDALSNLGMMSSSDVKKGDFPCKKAALLFARGTGEPGNMGYVVGPKLGSGLKKEMNGDVLIQGVDYSTNFSGGGAKEMVTLTKTIMSKCPDTKVLYSGYSQGAMQVHQALGSLGPDASKIAAAVTFGDPYSGQGWGSGGIVGAAMGLGGKASGGDGKAAGGVNGFNPNNGLIICSTGDFVCGVVPNIGGSVPKATASDASPSKGGAGHLSYMSDGSIPKALAFIAARVNGKGESSSEAKPSAQPKTAPKPKAASQPKAKSPPAHAHQEAAAPEAAAAAEPKAAAEPEAAAPEAAKPKGVAKAARPNGKAPAFAGDFPPMTEEEIDPE